MAIVLPVPKGQIIQVPNMRVPEQGAQALPFNLDFTLGTNLAGDLRNAVDSGELDFIQSIYIDNADNSSSVTVKFPGSRQRIVAQPFSEGYYACTPAVGDTQFTAQSNGGISVPVIFYNCPMPYVTWGPGTNSVVVPTLQNLAFAPLALNNGNTQLVPGAGGETIRVYRGMWQVDNPAILTFTDGPGGTVLFTVNLPTPGSSLTLNASNVPWWNATSTGNDLTVNSNAAVNLYGGMGYAQS